MTEPSISVSRDIPAPAGRIFSVLARPAAHPEMDGSGMVRTAFEDVVISEVGDVFVMNMFNDDMGEYVMLHALGHLLHELIEEGKQVAKAAGIQLHEDPWEMNKIGAKTNHPPSMLYDVRHQFIDRGRFSERRHCARSGARASAPLHTAVYRLIKGKEASWTFKDENRAVEL